MRSGLETHWQMCAGASDETYKVAEMAAGGVDGESPLSGVKSNVLLGDQEEAEKSQSLGLVAVARFIAFKGGRLRLEVGDDDHQRGTKFVSSVRLLGWNGWVGGDVCMRLLRCRWATGWSSGCIIARMFGVVNREWRVERGWQSGEGSNK